MADATCCCGDFDIDRAFWCCNQGGFALIDMKRSPGPVFLLECRIVNDINRRADTTSPQQKCSAFVELYVITQSVLRVTLCYTILST